MRNLNIAAMTGQAKSSGPKMVKGPIYIWGPLKDPNFKFCKQKCYVNEIGLSRGPLPIVEPIIDLIRIGGGWVTLIGVRAGPIYSN